MTEYEYEYYSAFQNWPNTNTNIIRASKNDRIRIRILFGSPKTQRWKHWDREELNWSPSSVKKHSRMKDSRDGLLRKNLNTRKSPEPKSLVGSWNKFPAEPSDTREVVSLWWPRSWHGTPLCLPPSLNCHDFIHHYQKADYCDTSLGNIRLQAEPLSCTIYGFTLWNIPSIYLVYDACIYILICSFKILVHISMFWSVLVHILVTFCIFWPLNWL